MQGQTHEMMLKLLQQQPQNAEAIAELLWKSTHNIYEYRTALDLIISHAPKTMYHAIAQSILTHGHDIKNKLLPNLVTTFKQASPFLNFQFFEVSNNLRYMVALSDTYMCCWDLMSKNSYPILLTEITRLNLFKFSQNSANLLYLEPHAVVRHTLDKGKQVRIPLTEGSSINALFDKFVAIIESSEHMLAIFDFDNPDKPLPIPAECKFLLDVSQDNKYLLLLTRDNTLILYNRETGTASALDKIQTITPKAYMFSPDSHYILTGIGTGTLTQWQLEHGTARQKRTYSTGSEFIYKKASMLAEGKMLLELSAHGSTSITISDLQSGSEELYPEVLSYKISADNNFIAFHKDNTIFVTDVQQQKLKTAIRCGFDPDAYYISPHGTYIAIKDTTGMTIYSTEDGSILMRFLTDASEYCFDETHEQYLIGYLGYDIQSDTQTTVFRNVCTGQFIGKINIALPFSKIINSCCKLILSYNTDTQTFKILKIDDVLQLDTELNNLQSINKALELALESNKQFIHSHVAELATKFNTAASLSYLHIFDLLERWRQYGDCIELLLQMAAPAKEPPLKRSRLPMVEHQKHQNILSIQQESMQDYNILRQLIKLNAETAQQQIYDFSRFMVEFLKLPPEEQIKFRTGALDKAIQYYPLVKDKLLPVAVGMELSSFQCPPWSLYALHAYIKIIPHMKAAKLLQQMGAN
jgi:hypothetical protein